MNGPLVGAVTGSSGAVEKAGLVFLLAACALLLVLRPTSRSRPFVAAFALVASPLLLLVDIWHSGPLHNLRNQGLLSAGGALGLVAVVAGLACLLRRKPAAIAPLALLALPFRVPIEAGGSVANLLIPLYGVIAAATIARVVLPAGETRTTQLRSGELPLQVVRYALGAYLLLYAIQSTYSPDFAKALQNATFFYAPFTLLLVVVSELAWTREVLRRCLGVTLALAAVFVAVGFVEYARGTLFLNPRLIAANEYDSYFRVNSVFFDPNIYGRFLALVMIAGVVALFRTRSRRLGVGLSLLLLCLGGGLLLTYSESSMVALLVGLAIVVGWRYDLLSAVLGLASLIALALIVVLLSPASAHFGLSGEGGGANNATSGRVGLVEGGLSLFAGRPLYGYGSGSFAKEYRLKERADKASAVSASHTTPVTVAAEQGLVGLLAYLALVASSLFTLFKEAGRAPPRLALAACYSALLVHTLAYADFLEDPTSWFLLGLGIALAKEAFGGSPKRAAVVQRQRPQPLPAGGG